MISDDSSSSEDSGDIVSETIRNQARNISLDLLPDVSKRLYTAAYNKFKQWRKKNGSNSFCEDVMLVYFHELSKTYAPSSLWSTYSMLKTTIDTFDKINIAKYDKLIYFLKKKNSGYRPKKSLVFTQENISKFLNEAPNDIYLSTKVALIFGIAGALRRQEFVNLEVKDIQIVQNMLLVNITKTKNKIPRSFTIANEFYDIVKQYIESRPQGCKTDRFFFKFSNGKCFQQPIGIHKFGSMPKSVALYLHLPNAHEYTGHSFRRTSATLLVNAGADITQLKRHGGWKSSTVAEGYIAYSINNKKRIYEQITSGISLHNKKVRVLNAPPEQNSIEEPEKPHETYSNTLNKTNTNNRDIDSQQIAPIVMESLSPDNVIDKEENMQKKFHEVFYDPMIGLYTLNTYDEKDKTVILNNCNITINGECHNAVFNNSSIKNQTKDNI